MPTINFQSVDYDKLPKAQKLAIFMILIGPEQAAQVFKMLDDVQSETICKHIASIKIMDEEIQQRVLEEFSGLVAESCESSLGGINFAQRALELSKGSLKASRILGRIGTAAETPEAIGEIVDMETRQVCNLIQNEQAQTIAFLLSHLSPNKAAEIITYLGDDKRQAVIERMGEMDTITGEMMGKVAETLKAHVSVGAKRSEYKTGGVKHVADLMKLLRKDMSKAILSSIDKSNQELATFIRKKMFSFDDLLKLSPRDMQRIARDIEMTDLVLALKPASALLQESFFKAVSKRAAETLKEEISLLDNVKAKEVELARDKIIQVVRRLEEEGEITLEARSEANGMG